MTVQLITPPASEPVTVDQAKIHLRLTTAQDDAHLASLIVAAREFIEVKTRRQLVTQTWRLFLEQWPVRRYVLLPFAPVQSIAAVRVFNAAGVASAVNPSAYLLDKTRTSAMLYLQSPLPAPTARANGIEIDVTAGYGAGSDVPAPLREALLRLVALWYEQRTTQDGTRGAQNAPTDVNALLAPYGRVRP